MKAARFYDAGDIRIDDIEPGAVGPNDVRVDVTACGICGSDLHEYDHPGVTPEQPHPRTGASRPITIGHEFSGIVSEVGEDVIGVAIGDPVAVHPNIPCHDCVYCEDGEYNRCDDVAAVGFQTGEGGFAENAVVPEQQVHCLPDGIDVWEGALVEPLAVGLHAIRRSRMQAGDSVAVVGCGPIGLTAVLLADHAGAKEVFVSEPNGNRREMASRLGADATIDPLEEDATETITAATDGGVNVAFEFAGSEPAFNAAVRSTRRGGTVTVGSMADRAITTNLIDIVQPERAVIGTFCYGFPPLSFRSEFGAIIEAISDGEIVTEPFVTARIGLEELVEEGYEALLEPGTEHAKILVEP